MKSRLDQPELQPLRSDYQLLHDAAKAPAHCRDLETILMIIVGLIAWGLILGTGFALLGA